MSRLSELATLQAGKAAYRFTKIGTPYVRALDLERTWGTDAEVRRLSDGSSRAWPARTVLIALGVPLNRAWLLSSPAHVAPDVITVSCHERLSPDYLLAWLRARPADHILEDVQAVHELRLSPPSFGLQLEVAGNLLLPSKLILQRLQTLVIARQLALKLLDDPFAPRAALDVLAKIQKGRHIPRRELSSKPEGVEYVTARDLLPYENRVGPASLWLPPSSRRGTLAPAGSTLVVADASALSHLGTSALLDREAYIHPDLVALTPRDQVTPFWLSLECQRQQARWQLQTMDSGQRVSVHVGRIRETAVPVPPLVQQRGGILGLLARQRESGQASLALLERLLDTLQKAAFDPATAEGVPTVGSEAAREELERLSVLRLSAPLVAMLRRARQGGAYLTLDDLAGKGLDHANTVALANLLIKLGLLVRVRVNSRTAFRLHDPLRDRASFNRKTR